MAMAENKDKKVLNVPNLRFPEFEGEWEKCKVGDFGKIITGNTPPTKDIENYENGQYLWVSPADLGLLKSITETKTKLSKKGFDKTRALPAGSVLVTCIGSTIGKMGMTTRETSTNQQINAIVVNKSNNNEFVYYAVQSAFPKYLSSIAVQAVPIISKSSFELLPNYRPSIQEQEKIGRLFALLDERIATQSKIIEKLQSLIKGICNNYFLKLSHSQEMKSIRLGDILKERNEYCCKDGTFVHGTLSKDGLFPKTERWNRDFLVKEENKKYKITHLDDICYNPANLKFGVICRNIYGDLIFSPIYVTFEVSKKVNIGFIELYLTNRNFIEKIRKFEQGTVYERMSVSPKDFLSYKIRIPSLSEQTFFYQKIQRLKNCSQNELEHLNLYKKLRQYLLRQMFI